MKSNKSLTAREMVLQKKIERTAKWNQDTGRWDIQDGLTFSWHTLNNKQQSPPFRELSAALQWIIEHDRNKNLS